MPTLYDNFERVKNFIDENNTSYVSKTELAYASYITQADLGQMSYATKSDLNKYLRTSGDTISGSILLNNSSIDIGNLNNGLRTLWVTNVSAHSGEVLYFRNGSTNQVGINNGFLYPATNNSKNLGAINFQWKAAYTYSLYLGSTNIEDKFATPAYVADYVSTYGGGTPDLSAYVTKTELSGMSYATTTDLTGTILPRNNSDNGSYSLGSVDHPYNTVQAMKFTIGTGLYGTKGQADITKTTQGIAFSSHVVPSSDGSNNLGHTDYEWNYAYISNLILNGTNIKTLINNMFSYDTTTGTLTITTL